MLLRNLLVVLSLVLSIGLCNAQSAPVKPIEPTAFGVVYLLDPTSLELKRLPDEKWKQKDQGKTFRSEMSIYVEVSGDRSYFRLKADTRFEFVFKTENPEKVTLYRFEEKDNNRQFEIGVRSDNYSNASHIKGLPIKVSQFGASSSKLIPASPFTPGEYAIMIAGEVYTFGID
jgi:hypothetical protein